MNIRTHYRTRKRGKASKAKRKRDIREASLKQWLSNEYVLESIHVDYFEKWKNRQIALKCSHNVSNLLVVQETNISIQTKEKNTGFQTDLRYKLYGEIPCTSTHAEESHAYNYHKSASDNEQKPSVEDLDIKENIEFCDTDVNLYQCRCVQQPMNEIAGPSTQNPLESEFIVRSIKNEPFDSEVTVSCKQEPLEIVSFVKQIPSEQVININVDILIDGEEKFLLSLLPHVCFLTVEEKVNFQTKTLQLLNDIVNLRNNH